MRTRHRLTALFIALTLTATSAFPTGYPVFDLSGWLTAIDQLYQEYEMVMNTITQIENQYRQIQLAVERAKTIDWENLSFDGDFDIRNDIRNADRRINRLLSQARIMKGTLTSPTIDCGYGRYSLADLCGMSGPDHNFAAAVSTMGRYMSDTMSGTIRSIEDGLTDKQRRMIWKKYGISPKNYLFVQQSVSQVKDQAARALAKATDEAVELRREETIARANAVIEAAYSQTDSDGNMTEAAASEAGLYLSQQMIDGLLAIDESVNDLASLEAIRLVSEENARQAEADEMAAEQQRQEAFDYKVPDSFRR